MADAQNLVVGERHHLTAVDGKYIVLPPWDRGNASDRRNMAIPDPYAQGTTKLYSIGTKFVDFDREWRYTYNGSTDTLNEGWGAMSYVLQAQQGNPAADIAAGATKITMDDVGSFAKDFYAGGYLLVKPADGYMYRILAHGVADSSSTIEYEIDRPGGFNAAVTTGATMIVIPNMYADVRKASGVTGGVTGYTTFVGVPAIPILTLNYFWAQVKGPAWIAGADNYGNVAHERQFYFWTDGSVALESDGVSGQICGVAIPFTNPAGASEVYYGANIIMNLQIAN